ncbi:hypothetical protein [Pseudomonas orientalis]|uniref:Uncharacterized protein n=1 Tax=Pseudomonas orientalis TaxID=76758 RepID=A0A0R3A6U1_9PSED|nr:hypothetical protein [Pseudomonas orientalis]KRP65729.1 hypothetical protein TU82_08105 [Pseudomonas orientalis]KRP66389.1 hypothetical protein TU82_04460 [Pseudomonas orientalis]SDT87634.1 hypothetical protein SAMN04490197_0256 [Pseudomonas orientalis]
MHHTDTYAKRMACRQLAMEQNQKLFDEANALSRSAFDLLECADFDSEKFDQYLRLRAKAEALFREAIEHLGVLNTHFPTPASSVANNEGVKVVIREREVA